MRNIIFDEKKIKFASKTVKLSNLNIDGIFSILSSHNFIDDRRVGDGMVKKATTTIIKNSREFLTHEILIGKW